MRSQLVFAAALTLALVSVSEAQTPAASAPAQTPAVSPPSPTPAREARQERVKGERDTCRTEAKSQGLKGEAVRTAVMDCMKKVDPVVAKRMGCAQAAKAKNLAGDDLKKSVRECMTGAG